MILRRMRAMLEMLQDEVRPPVTSPPLSLSVTNTQPVNAPDPPNWSALTRVIPSARGAITARSARTGPVNEKLCVTYGGTSRLLHGYVYGDTPTASTSLSAETAITLTHPPS